MVTDRSDPKLVHLDGLNLSRAWCMRSIARALPANDPARKVLSASSEKHAAAALAHVASRAYAGEHWLASFAVSCCQTKSSFTCKSPRLSRSIRSLGARYENYSYLHRR